MNLRQNQKGFTIVELLIVVVVIAILAAISIVAYTGIQARAMTSAGKNLASQVERKASVHFMLADRYPYSYPIATGANSFASFPESALEGIASNVIAQPETLDESVYSNGKIVTYRPCGTNGTGARITYWDYNEGAVVSKTLGTGNCTWEW